MEVDDHWDTAEDYRGWIILFGETVDKRFVSFSQRQGKSAPFRLIDGAPAHLRNVLEPMIEAVFFGHTHGISYFTSSSSRLLNQMILDLHLPIAEQTDEERYFALRSLLRNDEHFLNVVDYLLFAEKLPSQAVEEVLYYGGSAYSAVNNHLTERVDSTLAHLVQEITDDESKASEHLASAWQKAYGRNADPHAAWMSANHAIEALLKPVTLPKDKRFSISRAVAAIKDSPSKWEFELGAQNHGNGLNTFVSLLSMMFPEPAHHGGNGEEGPTIQEAQAAVTLATTIVQWLRSGAFRFREDQS